MTSDKHGYPHGVIRLNLAAIRADYQGVTDAPRISTAHIRLTLGDRRAVVAQDLRSGMVIAMPAGLSKTEAADPDLCVILTHDQARSFYDLVGENYEAAARSATAILAFEMQTIDARLAAWAAKGADL